MSEKLTELGVKIAEMQKAYDDLKKEENPLAGKAVKLESAEQWDHIAGATDNIPWKTCPRCFESLTCFMTFYTNGDSGTKGNGQNSNYGIGISYSEACDLLGVDPIVPKLEKGDKVRLMDEDDSEWAYGYYDKELHGVFYSHEAVIAGGRITASWEIAEAFEWTEENLKEGLK